MSRKSISSGIIELDNSTLHETKENIRLDQLLPPDILADKTKLDQLLQSYYTFMNMDEFIYQENETFTDVVLDGIARFRILDPTNKNSEFFTDETGASSTLTLTSPSGKSPAEFTFDGSSSSIVNTSNNSLDLTTFQQKALPVGTRIQYDVGDGSVIGGLSDDTDYFVVFSSNNQVKLSLTLGGSIINLSSVGSGKVHKIRGTLATMTIPLTAVNVAVTNGNDLPGTLAKSTSEIGKTFSVNGLSSFNNYSASLTTIVKYWVGPGPSWVMNNIETAMDIDKNASNYLELMQKEIAAAVPRNVTVNKRNLYKRILDFYKVRGSADAVEIFFRLLFNDSVTVEFPYDSVLVPSSGAWDQPATVTTTLNGAVNNSTTLTLISANDSIRLSSKLTVGTTIGLADDIRVANISGSTITLSQAVTLADATTVNFVPRGIYLDNKGFLSNKIKIQDSNKFQKFSYLIKTGKNLADWENVFDKLVHPAGFIYFAEILIFLELSRKILGDDSFDVDTIRWDELTKIIRQVLSAMPLRQPGVIGVEDVPILVEMFASTFLPGTEAFIHKSGTLSLGLKSGVITAINVTAGGTGYTAAPIVGSQDAGTPSGHLSVATTAVLTNGRVSSINIIADSDGIIGGKDYNVPVLTIAAPTAMTFNPATAVNLSNNTITLTTAQAAALNNGDVVTYNSGGGGAIANLTTPQSYKVINKSGNNIKLELASNPQGAINLGSVGSGTSHTLTGVTATATATKSDGQLESITIIEPGFGYASAPAISFTGIETSSGSGTNPSVTIGITSDGSLDKNNITINSVGGGWSNLFATPAGNPNSGKVAAVKIVGKADKKYKSAPAIVFTQPTAKDVDGVLLGSNVLAVASFSLDSEGEITNTILTAANGGITNVGNGYTADPIVTLGSAVSNEERVADVPEKVIISANHNDIDNLITEIKINPRQTSGSKRGYTLYDGQRFDVAKDTLLINPGQSDHNPDFTITQQTPVADKFLAEHTVKVLDPNFRTIINNGYKPRKGINNFFTSARLYNTNQTIEFLGSNTLQTIAFNDINKYNTRTFVE
jgi:hypothetical protein